MKKWPIVSLSVVVALVIGVIFVSFIINSNDTENTQHKDGATSEQEVSQSNEDTNSEENKRVGSSNTESEGTVTDTGGTDSTAGSEEHWITSSTGEITIHSPHKGALLQSGDILSGSSELASVYFRLIDNVSGVIARGELKVKDGKFSGKFNFDTEATEGRLDVFGVRDDGKEFSNIEIPIKF